MSNQQAAATQAAADKQHTRQKHCIDGNEVNMHQIDHRAGIDQTPAAAGSLVLCSLSLSIAAQNCLAAASSIDTTTAD